MKNKTVLQKEVKKKINITKSALLGIGVEVTYLVGRSAEFFNRKFNFYVLDNCITIPMWYFILLASLPLLPTVIDKTIYATKKDKESTNSEIINSIDKVRSHNKKLEKYDGVKEINNKLQAYMKVSGGK